MRIDRSFVVAMTASASGVALTGTMREPARALGRTTVADGNEDQSQLAALLAERCEAGQGFLLSRPLEADQIDLLRQRPAPRAHGGARLALSGPRGRVATLGGDDDTGPMLSSAEITIDTDDGPMAAFEAIPEGEPKGSVVVVQEAFGVTSHICDVAQRLADDGWRAVAPAFFHRQGSPVLDYDDMSSVMPVMGTIGAAGLEADLEATFDYLGRAPERTGIVGFCMGGTVSFFAATLEPLGAAVTFYGGGVDTGRFGLPPLIELAPKLQTPWLGCYGDLDKGISVDSVEQLRASAQLAPVETEVVRYADADHGFHCDDRPAVFNPTAAHDAWERTLQWFDRHLGG